MFSREMKTPVYYSFVKEDEKGNVQYGTMLKFYESPSHIIKEYFKTYHFYDFDKLFSPKILCLTSSFSFTEQQLEILKQIYRIHMSTMSVPIEANY